jgi:hypothetical protein
MACSCCYNTIADEHFNERVARRDLERYRKDRPGATARLLRDIIGRSR